MAGLDPFIPDDEYCVYCNAPADGMCADCGALCCGDCADLVMGWTTQRAVCDSCMSDRDLDQATETSPAVLVALATGILMIVVMLWRG